MHIEPGIVTGAKLGLGFVTGSAAVVYGVRQIFETVRGYGVTSFAVRSLAAFVLVFSFFEILPHYPVGVSEVHFILGSTLFLVLGAGPAAMGLALGLLAQGLFLAPLDLPQYGMNLTTLLVPLFAIQTLAGRIVAPGTAYVDLTYGQVLKLSAAYQGGVVAWVAFWALYGQGMAAENLSAVSGFAGAYMLVVLLEPLVDLAVLAIARTGRHFGHGGLVEPRLYQGR